MSLETPELSKTQQALINLKEFITANPDKKQTVELPANTYDALVPERIYEVATQPDNVEILHQLDTQELALIIVERNMQTPLTRQEDWDMWQSTIQTAIQNPDEFTFVEQTPATINSLQAKFADKIEAGEIKLNDRILMSVKLRTLPGNTSALYVGDYDGEAHLGIGTAFFKDTLPEVAKTLGFRFISGANDASNIEFFTKGLGRYTYTQIKEEYRDLLFSRTNATNGQDQITVQFLYPEDIAKYIIEK